VVPEPGQASDLAISGNAPGRDLAHGCEDSRVER
jgi:hypothetical protein